MREKATKYYPDYKTAPEQAREHFKYWHSFAEKCLY